MAEWSDDETTELLAMYRGGFQQKRIAEILGRPLRSIEYKLRHLHKPKERRQRKKLTIPVSFSLRKTTLDRLTAAARRHNQTRSKFLSDLLDKLIPPA